MIDAWLGRFSKYTSYSQIDIKVSHSLSLTKTLLEMIELFQYSAQCAFLVKGLQKMNRPMLVSFHSFHLWLFPTWRQCHSRCRCCTCTFYSILFVCLYFAPVSRNFASLSHMWPLWLPKQCAQLNIHGMHDILRAASFLSVSSELTKLKNTFLSSIPKADDENWTISPANLKVQKRF